MGSRRSLQQNSGGGGLNRIASHRMRLNMVLAALAGLALRIFFILKFPVTDSGDAPFYIELAWNWLKNRVYGFPVHRELHRGCSNRNARHISDGRGDSGAD